MSSFLSICMKAGKLRSGEDTCEKLLRGGYVFLIIVAEDASGNTKKKFFQKTFYYKTPMAIISTKEELSRCIGKANRSVFAITDGGCAENILEMAKQEGGSQIAMNQTAEILSGNPKMEAF